MYKRQRYLGKSRLEDSLRGMVVVVVVVVVVIVVAGFTSLPFRTFSFTPNVKVDNKCSTYP